ncbi:MAG: TIGR00282 family metallophosphoesterase [Pseudomonadota bacterium]
MRVLFLGDIVGRSGRTAVIDQLPALKTKLAADMVILNGENAAGGFGITEKIADDLYAAGADCITTGNHVWDQRQILGHIDREPRLLRPANFPAGTPGRGASLISLVDGRQVLVINVMGRIYMDPLDDPFAAVDAALGEIRLGESVDAIVVDVHAEASSEKMAMAHYLDGRVSFVVGTHTHVPTADAQILPGGTAYQTDAGMCGDYLSVIGMKPDEPVRRFTTKMSGGRFEPAEGEATLCGVVVDIHDRTGLARKVSPVRIGGRLAAQVPEVIG